MRKEIHPGKLIVIEGTDGSGKKTQTKLLADRLQEEGIKTSTLSFPQYGKKSAGPVEEYLNGRYGDPDKVDPYAASLFFAIDRFDIAGEIKNRLGEGYSVVLDRYVDSNAGHQGGKIAGEDARKIFLRWLYDIEYEILKIPKPNITIILYVPASVGQSLVYKKQERLYIEGGKRADGHEENLEHLRRAGESYLWLARENPLDHVVVECAPEGDILPADKIHDKVWRVLRNKKII